MWLFFSLSSCSVHMIPGIDWINLLFFIYFLSSMSSSKVGGQEGTEGVTPKSIPLRHKLAYFAERKRGKHKLRLPIFLVFYRTGLIVKQYYT